MPYVIGMLLLMGGGFVVQRFYARRLPLSYPQPETHIIEPESLLALEQRILVLSGGVNFRDLGGYRTTDGHSVKTGLVYRAGALNRLTDEDWQMLQEKHIKLVCDLRSQNEVAKEPDPIQPGSTYLHLPINTESHALDRLRALFFTHEQIDDLLPYLYTRIMIDQNAQVIGEILRRLADPENLPTIIHCTAGKDRTGVASALLLLVLGVPEETVIADYTLSNRYYKTFFEVAEVALKPLKRWGFRAEDLQPLLQANPETMRTVIAYVKQKYGSVEDFLHHAAGVDEALIQRLKANLLE